MRNLIVASGMLALSFAAHCQGQGDLPKSNFKTEWVCPKANEKGERPQADVDKELLAAQFLRLEKVPATLVLWANQTVHRPDHVGPMAFLVSKGCQVCTAQFGATCIDFDIKLFDAEPHICKGDDASSLKNAAASFALFFADVAQSNQKDIKYVGPTIDSHIPPSPTKVFTDPEIRFVCVAKQSSPKPDDNTAKKEGDAKPAIDIRVRGKADDLYAPAGSSGFSAADKASISYNQDDVKHKRVRVASGVFGVGINLLDSFPTKDDPNTAIAWLVPYLGVNSNISKTSGSNASVSTDNRSAGLDLTGYYDSPFAYYWSLRPQLLWDLTDRSRVFSTQAKLTPVVLYWINSRQEIGESGYFFQWLLDARYLHGHYTSLGKRKASDSLDFDRAGGQAGFEVDRIGPLLPWQLKVTETYVSGFGDDERNLGQFASTLSIPFGDKKQASLDFTYTDGPDIQTAVKDKSWKVSLGIKY